MNRGEDIRGLVHEMFEGIRIGDPRLFLERLHEDVVLTIPGSSSWCGVFEGREAFINAYLGRLRRSATSGVGRLEPARILVDGDWAVIESVNALTLEDGRVNLNHYCMLFRFDEGMIVEMRQYFDTAGREAVVGPFDG
ncbi:nuclear transport factor 2 family protein [Rhodovulum sp. DZ06]|uniref:nuclear transport factor 2 family protein n=1 Tax=Rhodovulum sp. DZ06 TaxID=3425126 RepID=UPI003D333F43